jgi:HlyD family secretion protein
MKPLPRGACFAALALTLLASILSGCESSAGDQPSAVPAAERRGVTALGRLEPRDRVIDVSVAGDERLERMVVKEGQLVKVGDTLAYLQSFENRTASRNRAAALLEDAETRMAAETQQAQARIQEAELRLRQLKEVPGLEIQAQQARIRETRADLNLALLNLERAEGLLKDSIVPRQEFDRQRALVDRLRATLESEEATLQKLNRAAETDRQIAEAQLMTRRKELDSVQASAQIASLKKSLEVAEVELRHSIIRAPSDGRIIEVIANPGESVLDRVVLRMGDISQMYALAEVYETDMARVQLGQKAEISSPALSKPLTGVVERLGTSVFKRQVRSIDPQADADARVIQVRVRLDDSEEASRFVGLQVDVLIHSE